MKKYSGGHILYSIFQKQFQKDYKLRERISEDILKCVIYQNTTHEYQHWIQDAAKCILSKVHRRFTIGTIAQKQTKYRSMLFEWGTTTTDIEFNLGWLHDHCAVTDHYTDFDHEDISLLRISRCACDDIEDSISLELARLGPRHVSFEYLVEVFHEVLDNYCKGDNCYKITSS